MTTDTEPARRLTLSQIVAQLIDAQRRGSGEHSGVTLTRNARGDVQIAVAVRTGDEGVTTVAEAAERAREVFDALARLYPMAVAE